MIINKNNFFFSCNKSDKFFLILIIFFPVFLISGPFLTDMAAIILSIYILYKIFIRNEKILISVFSSVIVKSFLIFWIFISIRSLFSIEPLVSFKSSFLSIRFFLFALSIFYFCKIYNKKFINIIFKVLFFTIIAVLIDTLIQFVFDFDIFGYPKLEHRLSGPFGDELIVGSFLARLLPVLIATFYYVNSKNNFFFIIFIFILCSSVFVIFISGERVSFFYGIINLIVFLYFLKMKNKLKIVLFFLSLMISIFFFILNNNKAISFRIINHTLCEMNIKSFEKNEYLSKNNIECPKKENDKIIFFSRTYEAHFGIAYNIFEDYKIYGSGIKTFRFHCLDKKYSIPGGCNTHPHNLFFQILAEAGIVGLIFLFIYLFLTYKKFFYFLKKKFLNAISHQDIVEISALTGIINIFILFLPTGNYFSNWTGLITSYLIGFYLFFNTNFNRN